MIAFLLARFAEDEEIARAATPGPWRWGEDLERGMESATVLEGSTYDGEGNFFDRYTRLPSETPPFGARPEWESPLAVISAFGIHTDGFVNIEGRDAAHIARWDPTRVLAELAAKRALLKLHPNHNAGWDPEFVPPVCGGCEDSAWPCKTLKALALPYADHPNYREEWAR